MGLNSKVCTSPLLGTYSWRTSPLHSDMPTGLLTTTTLPPTGNTCSTTLEWFVRAMFTKEINSESYSEEANDETYTMYHLCKNIFNSIYYIIYLCRQSVQTQKGNNFKTMVIFVDEEAGAEEWYLKETQRGLNHICDFFFLKTK